MPIVRGGYGKDLYSSGDFGTEGVIHDGSALISATSVLVAEGGRSLKSSAIVSVTSSVVSNSVRERESSASVSATLTVVASGEGIIREDSDKFAYGTGLYSVNEYDQADLQTIISATSSIVNVAGVRVQHATASVSASASIVSNAEKISLGSAISSPSASVTARGVFITNGSASTSANSTIAISFIRERNIGALVSTTSGTLAVGREKWEVIPPTSTTWTIIAA